jgi:hypothetical protein
MSSMVRLVVFCGTEQQCKNSGLSHVRAAVTGSKISVGFTNLRRNSKALYVHRYWYCLDDPEAARLTILVLWLAVTLVPKP